MYCHNGILYFIHFYFNRIYLLYLFNGNLVTTFDDCLYRVISLSYQTDLNVFHAYTHWLYIVNNI